VPPKGRIAPRTLNTRERRASTPATIPSSSPTARCRRRGSPAGLTIEAVTTPGHTANHMAFALKEGNLLFSGDHVMAWSTPIVAPPDGAMSDYMASLQKLAGRSESIYLPGHGGAVREAPRFVQHYIRHRQSREASILHRSARAKPISPPLHRVIIGLDPRLVKAAHFCSPTSRI
jgi:glyoxylase-like metal-dependent hydrolase (beta-lactamase superfamily II)